MILPALVALTVAGGLLARGCWDLWAQSLVHMAVAAGLTLWLASRVMLGYVPLPSRRNLLWTGGLLLLSGAAVWLSPIRDLSVPYWHNFLCALWIFPVITALSKDERFYIDEAVRAAAWVLMILACYQRVVLGDVRPESALVNVNVYAGTVLLLLPLAVEKRDWLLATGLLLNLWWASSVGAWLGLCAAVILTTPWRGGFRLWGGLAGALLCMVLIYNKFQSPDVLNRWTWWSAAAGMIFDRPLTGFGPGAYAYVLQSYKEAGGLGTIFAHQYLLETAAGFGLPFAVLWFAGLWHCLQSSKSYKRFGALALLVHSLWDWPLSLPANLWLFSYFAASSISEGSEGVNVRSRYRLPLCALIVALGALVTMRVWNIWAADRAKVRSAAAMQEGDLSRARAEALRALRLRPEDHEIHLLLSAVHTRHAAATVPDHGPALEAAAGHLERASRLNPYRPATWTELALALRKLGRDREAGEALARGARWCPRLEAPPAAEPR